MKQRSEWGEKIWKQIELPECLDEQISQAVALGCKRRKRMQRKRMFGFTGAAAAIFAVCITLGYTNSAVACAMEEIPLLGKIFAYLYQSEGTESPYTQIYEKAEPVPGEEPESLSCTDQGIHMEISEYYCTADTLYLSMLIRSEQPYSESLEIAGQNGKFQLFTGSDSGGEVLGAEDGVWNLEGIFTDVNTFAGIVRIEQSDLLEQSCRVHIQHMKGYLPQGEIRDVRGLWEMSFDVQEEDILEQKIEVDEFSDAENGIFEVRIQPFELHVETTSLTQDSAPRFLVVLDQKGDPLRPAESQLSSPGLEGEVWKYERTGQEKTLYLFIVDELKWMDEWKGYYYNGEMSGKKWIQFLQKNSMVHAELKIGQQ